MPDGPSPPLATTPRPARAGGRWRRRLRRGAVVLLAAAAGLLALRVYQTQGGPPLGAWHTEAPAELSAEEIGRADWARWLAAEDAAFAAVRRDVTEALPEAARVPSNRYFAGSPVHAPGLSRDWNRSYALEPEGLPPGAPPSGAVVLLHGMTDSPYSLRHVGRLYAARGWAVVAVRLPGHGTVPAGLAAVAWEDWAAAARLAVREAVRRLGPGGGPLHVVGFSNGGALAVMHALDAAADPSLGRPERVVLVSPMIGVTTAARFAWLAALPAVVPRWAKASWLSVTPEFNPFKYNSFPVNGAVQSHRLTAALRARVERAARDGTLARMPPVLAFQPVVDFTVSTAAVVRDLFDHLPANGSELVLFDLNRDARLGPLVRPSALGALEALLPPSGAAGRRFRATVVGNAAGSAEAVERSTGPGEAAARERPLGVAWPRDVFSLSHVALPFPPWDGLYGSDPDPAEDYGVRLGALASRGERGVLVASLDALLRGSSNPFYLYMTERVAEGIGGRR